MKRARFHSVISSKKFHARAGSRKKQRSTRMVRRKQTCIYCESILVLPQNVPDSGQVRLRSQLTRFDVFRANKQKHTHTSQASVIFRFTCVKSKQTSSRAGERWMIEISHDEHTRKNKSERVILFFCRQPIVFI